MRRSRGLDESCSFKDDKMSRKKEEMADVRATKRKEMEEKENKREKVRAEMLERAKNLALEAAERDVDKIKERLKQNGECPSLFGKDHMICALGGLNVVGRLWDDAGSGLYNETNLLYQQRVIELLGSENVQIKDVKVQGELAAGGMGPPQEWYAPGFVLRS